MTFACEIDRLYSSTKYPAKSTLRLRILQIPIPSPEIGPEYGTYFTVMKFQFLYGVVYVNVATPSGTRAPGTTGQRGWCQRESPALQGLADRWPALRRPQCRANAHNSTG